MVPPAWPSSRLPCAAASRAVPGSTCRQWSRGTRGGAPSFDGRRQLACLVVLDQRIDQRIQPAVEYLRQVVHRQPDAVVGHAILREVIGADLFAAVATAHLRAARLA